LSGRHFFQQTIFWEAAPDQSWGGAFGQQLAGAQLRVGLTSFQLPKVHKSPKDAHVKTMSTFETDEHLLATHLLRLGCQCAYLLA
jgi:hypothetical protein